MPSTYTALDYHIIYSTKDRRNQITADIRQRLYDYLGGIIKEQRGQMRIAGGVEDHIHILARLSPTIALSDVLRVIKTNSSSWVHDTFPNHDFTWQTGYAAFAVSRSNVEAVRHYIATQEEHHRTMTFKEELLALLRKHEVEFDERYIWD